MTEYLVTIGGRTYEVEGETRAKAIVKAAHKFREETGAKYTISVLIASAKTKKVQGGKDRYPPLELEVPNA